MKAQPEMKWNLVKAGILAAFGLAIAGFAIALPAPTQSPASPDPVAGSSADSFGMLAAVRAEDEAPLTDPREVVGRPIGSRDPSLAGLRVSPDAPDTAPIETD